jgi:hypothetical protein
MLDDQRPQARPASPTLARAATYRNAGADGIVVPEHVDPESMRAIASSIRLPLNVMVRPGVPPAAELAALGVRRRSTGTAIAQTLWAHAGALAGSFPRDGRSKPLRGGRMPYPDINALFQGRSGAALAHRQRVRASSCSITPRHRTASNRCVLEEARQV